MKKFLLFLSLSFCIITICNGQGHDTTNANLNHLQYHKGVTAIGQELIIPKDTIPSIYWSPYGSIAIKNGVFYYNNGTKYVTPSGGISSQILSFGNDTLYISNGNSVYLPYNLNIQDSFSSKSITLNNGFGILGLNLTYSLEGNPIFTPYVDTGLLFPFVRNIVHDTFNNVTANNFIPGVQTFTTSATVINLTQSSPQWTELVGSNNQTIILPDVTTLDKKGYTYYVDNFSGGVVSLRTFGGINLQTIPPQSFCWVTVVSLTDNSFLGWNSVYIPQFTSSAIPNRGITRNQNGDFDVNTQSSSDSSLLPASDAFVKRAIVGFSSGGVTSIAAGFGLATLLSNPITTIGTLYVDSSKIAYWVDTLNGNRSLVTPTFLASKGYLTTVNTNLHTIMITGDSTSQNYWFVPDLTKPFSTAIGGFGIYIGAGTDKTSGRLLIRDTALDPKNNIILRTDNGVTQLSFAGGQFLRGKRVGIFALADTNGGVRMWFSGRNNNGNTYLNIDTAGIGFSNNNFGSINKLIFSIATSNKFSIVPNQTGTLLQTSDTIGSGSNVSGLIATKKQIDSLGLLISSGGGGTLTSITFANGLKTMASNPITTSGIAIADSNVVAFWQDTLFHQIVTNTYLNSKNYLTSFTTNLNSTLLSGDSSIHGIFISPYLNRTFSIGVGHGASVAIGMEPDGGGIVTVQDTTGVNGTNPYGVITMKVGGALGSGRFTSAEVHVASGIFNSNLALNKQNSIFLIIDTIGKDPIVDIVGQGNNYQQIDTNSHYYTQAGYSGSFVSRIKFPFLTRNDTILYPDKSGTIALLSDIINSGGTVTSIQAGNGMNFPTITLSGLVNVDSTKVIFWYDTTLGYRKLVTPTFLASYVSGFGYGNGTVTSVGLSLPSIFSVTPTPITTSGTFSVVFSSGQTNNLVLRTGTSGVVGLSSLTSADIPSLNYVSSIVGTLNRISIIGTLTPTVDISASYVGQSSITTLGTITSATWNATKVGLLYGGTNADLSATGGAHFVLRQSSSGANITVSQLSASDLSDGTTGSGGGVVLSTAPTLSNAVVGTQTVGDNSTKAASTAFVTSAISTASSAYVPYSGASSSINLGSQTLTTTGIVNIGITNITGFLTGLSNSVTAMSMVNPLANFEGSSNNYMQLNIRNQSSGTSASGDIIVTADNGSDILHYFDMGMNSSGNTSATWGGTDDAYIYSSDDNFTTGTASNKTYTINTGGGTTTNARLTISGTGAITLNGFTTAGVIHNSSAGLLSSGLIVNADISSATINLTTKVTGILPKPNGGTGNSSGTADAITTARNIFGESFDGTSNVTGIAYMTGLSLLGSTSGTLNIIPAVTTTSYTWVSPSSIASSTGMIEQVYSISGTTQYTQWVTAGGGSSYTFASGITNSSGTVTNDLITGVSGTNFTAAQTIVGGNSSSAYLGLDIRANMSTSGEWMIRFTQPSSDGNAIIAGFYGGNAGNNDQWHISNGGVVTASGSQVFNSTVNINGLITIGDAQNIAVGTTTGTKIGTSTSQKLGFFNSTPIVQQTGNLISGLNSLGLIVSGSLSSGDIPNNTANTTGTANVSGGTLGAIPYQSATNTTTVLAATSTAGKMFQSGAFAAPSWSTCTYPSTSGAIGNVPMSDGTNFVSSVNNGGWTVLKVSGSDATTTGQTLVDVTGLVSSTLSVSTSYEFEAVLNTTTSAVTTGTEYGINITVAPTLALATYVGSLTSTTGSVNSTTVNNTASIAFNTTSSEAGIIVIKGIITTAGTGSPVFSIRHLKVTSGTSTVKIGSVLRIRQL